ncbi:MAG: hypothetical protein JW774_12140 [Candidatus Aureabacteria bacterium]|nr:hypothetical protein [Candidatus Auribacterota bacterium]
MFRHMLLVGMFGLIFLTPVTGKIPEGYLSPHSLFLEENPEHPFHDTFQEMVHSLVEYPCITESGCRRNLRLIEALLEKFEHPIVFSLDIDYTLVSKDKLKIKYLKELILLLKRKGHLVGIVTHRVFMQFSYDDPDDFEALKKDKEYIEIIDILSRYGLTLDDLDFFSIGVLTKDQNWHNFLRVRRNPGVNVFIETSEPIHYHQMSKTAKIASLAHIDKILRTVCHWDVFNGAFLMQVDDDGLQGHTMVSLNPMHVTHEAYIQRLKDELDDADSVWETMNRVRCFAGIIVPVSKEGHFTFTNIPDTLPIPWNKELAHTDPIQMFDLSSAVLKQLQRAMSSSFDHDFLIPELPAVFIQRSPESFVQPGIIDSLIKTFEEGREASS